LSPLEFFKFRSSYQLSWKPWWSPLVQWWSRWKFIWIPFSSSW